MKRLLPEPNLQPSTIYAHLTQLRQGRVRMNVARLIPSQTRRAIEQAIPAVGSDTLTPLDRDWGERYSLGEIRPITVAIETICHQGSVILA